MISLFRTIRKKLVVEGPPAGRVGKTAKYPKYAIGEILKCPVRDNLRVAIFMKQNPYAFRYEMLYTVPNGTEKHRN